MEQGLGLSFTGNTTTNVTAPLALVRDHQLLRQQVDVLAHSTISAETTLGTPARTLVVLGINADRGTAKATQVGTQMRALVQATGTRLLRTLKQRSFGRRLGFGTPRFKDVPPNISLGN
jgi:hypothetical protein